METQNEKYTREQAIEELKEGISKQGYTLKTVGQFYNLILEKESTTMTVTGISEYDCWRQALKAIIDNDFADENIEVIHEDA